MNKKMPCAHVHYVLKTKYPQHIYVHSVTHYMLITFLANKNKYRY